VIRRVRAPTLLLHGAQDRLVSILSARAAARLRSDWTFRVLDGVGHLGELEAPERFVEEVETWFAGPGRVALEAASGAGRRAAAG
jgi:pimeloyl-ACP methyl ester carboxylesterase